MYLYCIKHIKINIYQSYAQKHVSYTEWHKRFPIYHMLWLETSRNAFSIVFNSLFLFECTLRCVYIYRITQKLSDILPPIMNKKKIVFGMNNFYKLFLNGFRQSLRLFMASFSALIKSPIMKKFVDRVFHACSSIIRRLHYPYHVGKCS